MKLSVVKLINFNTQNFAMVEQPGYRNYNRTLSDDDYFRNSSIQPDTYSEDLDIKNLLLSQKHKKSIPFSSKKKYNKSDFKVLSLLGKGAYAKVVLARHIETKELKAIKIVDKSFIEKVFSTLKE